MVAELRIGVDCLLTNQDMNKEWTTQHEMRKVASFHFYIGRPPTTHELGVRSLPVGRGLGGKGDFYLELLRDRTHSKKQDDT